MKLPDVCPARAATSWGWPGRWPPDASPKGDHPSRPAPRGREPKASGGVGVARWAANPSTTAQATAKTTEGKKIKLSGKAQKAIVDLQNAVNKADYASLPGKLAAAKAVASTADDKPTASTAARDKEDMASLTRIRMLAVRP